MSKRDWRLYLDDIFECINKIEKYICDLTYDDFFHDSKTIDAVVRNLEIIGEAARQIPDVIKENYKEIPWREIIGLRNRLIHEYFGVDLEIIWVIIKHDLPDLKNKLQKIEDLNRNQYLNQA